MLNNIFFLKNQNFNIFNFYLCIVHAETSKSVETFEICLVQLGIFFSLHFRGLSITI